MTSERAKQIVEQAKAAASCGPWSDRLKDVMTEAETFDVLALWVTMPGDTCFVDALFRFRDAQED